MTDRLDKSLTLTQLVFYGVGTIIGAGIYSIIGAAAGEAGSLLWISFLAAGIAALLTALSYAELSSMFQKAGAEYQYLKHAFPRWRIIAFMAGSLIALNASATSATVSLAFGGYLGAFVDFPDVVAALILLMACTFLNIAGIRQATWVTIGMICIETAGLLLIIGGGIAAGDYSSNFKIPSMGEGGIAGGIFAATSLIFFVYIGFEDIANLSEEAVEPRRDVPRALLLSVLITSAIYILVALSVISLIEPAALAASDAPLREAGNAAAPWLGTAVAVTALFATASTALITLVSISRMLFGMARDGDMPRPLARTLPGRKTPWLAALALFGGACLLLPLGEIRIIASISAFGLLLVFIGIQAAVIRLRYTHPEQERPFRVPLAAGRLPLLPVAGIIMAALLLTHFDPKVYLVGAGVIAGALVLGLATGKGRTDESRLHRA